MKSLPRKSRIAWNEPGHAHFLTYSCFQRLPLLTRQRTRRWVIAAMEGVRRELDVQVWGYVIMPEHVHVLIYPNRDNYEMRVILAALKRPVSRHAKEYLERTGAGDWLKRLFADPAQGDFQLTANSPCKNTSDTGAVAIDTVDLDLDSDTNERNPKDLGRLPRVRLGTVDLGAYELFTDEPPGGGGDP